MPSSDTAPRIVTACVLIIGNEILSGRTQDANLAFLAQGLNEAGIRLREARVIPDDHDVIVSTVNEVRRGFDYVFTTGGIGPTHDDITAQCIADAFGVALIVHPEARRLLESHYPPGHLNEARLRMAMVPEGAALLPNPISRAPGFRIGNVHVLPGVPSIMQGIFEQLKYRLVGGDTVLSRSVSCHLAEGTLARDLAELQERYPDVRVERVVAWDNPAHALLEQSRRAQLLVVGSHGCSSFRGKLLGSVGAAAVNRAKSPVIVARQS